MPQCCAAAHHPAHFLSDESAALVERRVSDRWREKEQTFAHSSVHLSTLWPTRLSRMTSCLFFYLLYLYYFPDIVLFNMIHVFWNCVKRASVVFHGVVLVTPSLINRFAEFLWESLGFQFEPPHLGESLLDRKILGMKEEKVTSYAARFVASHLTEKKMSSCRELKSCQI